MTTSQSENIPQLSETCDVLWQELNTKDSRYKFKRSSQINHTFVVDYYCSELKLVVEVVDSQDGGVADKESWLLSHGYTLLYFTHSQVSHDREKVTDKIFHVCLHLSSLI